MMPLKLILLLSAMVITVILTIVTLITMDEKYRLAVGALSIFAIIAAAGVIIKLTPGADTALDMPAETQEAG